MKKNVANEKKGVGLHPTKCVLLRRINVVFDACDSSIHDINSFTSSSASLSSSYSSALQKRRIKSETITKREREQTLGPFLPQINVLSTDRSISCDADSTNETKRKLSKTLAYYNTKFHSLKHEKCWFQGQSQVVKEWETVDNFSWNNRSNDFLLAYYNYLNHVCEADDISIRNGKNLVSTEELMNQYSFLDNIQRPSNFITSDVISESLSPMSCDLREKYLSFTKRVDFQLSERHRLENEQANLWLCSYVGISPIQNIKFSDLLSVLDEICYKHSSK